MSILVTNGTVSCGSLDSSTSNINNPHPLQILIKTES